MDICFLSSLHTPYDKRVYFKEALSLVKMGFRVIHLAPGEEDSTFERNGVLIKTYTGSKKNIIDRLFYIPKLLFLALGINAKCYHCNELDSWFVGIIIKIIKNKKVIFDVHEHYPSRVAENYFPARLGPFVERTVKILFKLLSALTDGLIFAKKSVAGDFPKKVKSINVLNYTSLDGIRIEEKWRSNKSKNKPSNITAIHLGLINQVRGWPQLVDAMNIVNNSRLNIHIIGTFSDGSQDDFEQQIASTGIENRFDFENWMPFEKAHISLLNADIGLVLFQPGIKNHEYAFPHKLFDYMLAGLPVIAPKFAQEIKPIIEKEDCGILVDTSKPNEISRALDFLADNPDERKRLGNNGKKAVIKKYNWENEAEKLINFYLDLLRSG